MLHVALLLSAVMISEIELVFEFAGIIGCASVTFLFPALAFIQALNTYGTGRDRQNSEKFAFLLLARLFLLIFVVVLAFYFYL